MFTDLYVLNKQCFNQRLQAGKKYFALYNKTKYNSHYEHVFIIFMYLLYVQVSV